MNTIHTSHFLLGVDGGATKTIAVLADAHGMMLGRGQSGGSNKQASGVVAALAAVEEAIQAAFDNAGLPRCTVQAACFGLSGVDRPTDQELIRLWAAEHHICRTMTVVNDARLVLAAGTPDGYGVALICGTGSIAVGMAPDGRIGRAGGWGFLLGDEGSGHDIGSRALRLVTRAADGRAPATLLLPEVLHHWNLEQPHDLIRFIYNHPEPRSAIASLPPLVANVARHGDEAACRLLHDAGRELAEAAIAVAQQLDFEPPLHLALAGSVIHNIPEVRRGLEDELEQLHWPAILSAVEDPAHGALRLAAALADEYAAPFARSDAPMGAHYGAVVHTQSVGME
jgi:N-acetylglucosamine kinase-like BadF-type ATPase